MNEGGDVLDARVEKRNSFGIRLLIFGMAYVVSRVIFKLVGWDYNLFRDPFDAVKLAIDMVAWVVVYVVIERITRSRLAK